jgi:hypothetical protein
MKQATSETENRFIKHPFQIIFGFHQNKKYETKNFQNNQNKKPASRLPGIIL